LVKDLKGERYEVTFSFTPPIAAKKVFLAGTFNDWSPRKTPMKDADGDGRFEVTMALEAGRHEYKYVVDGAHWMADPDNPHRTPDGHGAHNSMLLLGEKATGGAPAAKRGDGTVVAEELYHGTGMEYACLSTRNRLRIRLRTRKGDVEEARALLGSGRTCPMERFATLGRHDFFEATVPIRTATARYAFKIRDGETTIYFGSKGASKRKSRVSLFSFKPSGPFLETPGWVRDAAFYQIFPERFQNGDPSNDPKVPMRPEGKAWNIHDRYMEPWGGKPSYNNFFGGDLKGILEKLPYLEELGISAIYLNPVFRSVSNHKYDTADYMKVDPGLGDMDLFKELTRTCHEKGIRVIIDGVFNHTGDEFWAFRDILKNQQKSRYLKWYFVKSFPVVVKGNPPYEAWWGFGDMPKLNTRNPEVREHLLKVAAYWIREGGADGWRLDVPNEVPHDFWVEFRKRVKAARRDAYIVGEIWQIRPEWLRGDEFDALMNYPFRQALIDFFVYEKIDAGEFDAALMLEHLHYPEQALPVRFNLIGSHDKPRFLTVCRGEERKLRLAVLFQLSALGAPVIYYGDEIGMEGGKDPDNRRCFPWDKKKWNPGLRAWYKKLLSIRRNEKSLRRGRHRTLFAEDRLYSFSRGDDVIVALNAGRGERIMEIPLPRAFAGEKHVFRDLLSGREFRVKRPAAAGAEGKGTEAPRGAGSGGKNGPGAGGTSGKGAEAPEEESSGESGGIAVLRLDLEGLSGVILKKTAE
jgi:glycosidase